MSIISRIPDNSRVRFPICLFESAVLDGFSQYAWAGVVSQIMTDLTPGNIYLIERVNFYANVSESDWLSSMIAEIDFPRISLQFQEIGGSTIYGGPFRCVNYIDNGEMLVYFPVQQKGDILTATMEGTVQQVPGMVGMATLRAQINFTVYEIIDRGWIDLYRRDPGRLGITALGGRA